MKMLTKIYLLMIVLAITVALALVNVGYAVAFFVAVSFIVLAPGAAKILVICALLFLIFLVHIFDKW